MNSFARHGVGARLPFAARDAGIAKSSGSRRAEKRSEPRDRTRSAELIRAGAWAGREARRASLSLALILSPGLIFASERARTFRIHAGGESLRVVVPKTFEPLLPGSVYPNRRKPVPAKGLPVAILDAESAPATEFLLERKFLVVQRGSAPVDAILAALQTRPEADARIAVVIAFRKTDDSSPRIRSTAIFDPDLEAPVRSSSGDAVAIFLATPRRTPSADLTRRLEERFGPHPIEKWYRSESGFPRQAYRDAAEWSALQVTR